LTPVRLKTIPITPSLKSVAFPQHHDFIKILKPKLTPLVKRYTLVLDLDETLIHFVPQDHKFYVRPYCG
jgi:hypothetical protein